MNLIITIILWFQPLAINAWANDYANAHSNSKFGSYDYCTDHPTTTDIQLENACAIVNHGTEY